MVERDTDGAARKAAVTQQEGERMSSEHLHPINCECHGCMDGRPVVLKAKKVEGKWQIVVSQEAAAEVVEAKLPGGALGFIAVLEKQAGLTQDEAIEVTEEAMKKMGMEPQFHIDNDHGHFDVNGKSDEEIAEFLDEQVGGCGFAARTWGAEGAAALIQKLKDRGWLVEVLDGHHEESEAKQIDKEGTAIHTQEASTAGEQAFTFNRPETQQALEVLTEVMNDKQIGNRNNFVSGSMEWFNSEFPAIADALRSIKEVTTVS